MKIAFLGASLTEGLYGGSYVNGVRDRLPDHEIINAGVNGSTINRLLERLDSVLAQSPDAIFILAGSNDAITYCQPATRAYYKSSQKLPDGFLSPEAYGQYYRELLEQAQLAFVRPLIGLPPLEYSPKIVEAAAIFNQQSAEAARAYNVPVLDLATPFTPPTVPARPDLGLKYVFTIGERLKSGWSDYDTEQQAGGYQHTFDGIHFTHAAADRAAALVTDFLREHLDV